MKHIYFLVLPNTHILDLAGPLQIMVSLKELGIANVVTTCIGPARSVKSYQNVVLNDLSGLPPRLPAGAIVFVIGSKIDTALMRSSAWKEASVWLRELNHRAASADLTFCGVCTGTLLLAHAGILDGYLCTTHHSFTQQLRQHHPKVTVLENRLYVTDRNRWTSAGVSSGIDLALQVVADFHGHSAAIRVARENVVNFRSFGADPALNALIRHRSHGNALVHHIQDTISSDLSCRYNLKALAQQANLSTRHLARVFLAETGLTVHQYQTELRVDRARSLLAGSTLSMERVAEKCGFGSVQALRACWSKEETLSLSAFRAKLAPSHP